MRRSKTECDTSFEAFMDEAGPALLRTAWFLTGDVERAQELTQAALVKTYVVWHKIDHHTARAYARRCLVNHKIDVWRATRHEVADTTSDGREHTQGWSPPSQSSSRDDAMAGVDHRDDLARRLSRLPEQQRKVVVLRYYADQSEAAVAEALGISVGSVKSAASRGLAALRRQDGSPAESHPAEAMDAMHATTAGTSIEGSLR